MASFSPPKLSVAIVGTSFRTAHDSDRFYPTLFLQMVVEAARRIELLLKERPGLSWGDIELVSGGQAGADHVAVRLFTERQFHSLKLFLPCEFDDHTGRFRDPSTYRPLPGKDSYAQTCNILHEAFSKQMGATCNSFKDLQNVARMRTVTMQSCSGFYQRNLCLARHCDVVIAFSWMRRASSPGTADVCNKARELHVPVVHVDLAELEKGIHQQKPTLLDRWTTLRGDRPRPNRLLPAIPEQEEAAAEPAGAVQA